MPQLRKRIAVIVHSRHCLNCRQSGGSWFGDLYADREWEWIDKKLDALFHGLPDELVDLEGEAGGKAVG
jgi:hypothetical protein